MQVLIRCVVLIGSGLATYHLILTPIWKFEISVLHLGRGEETSIRNCIIPWAGDVSVAKSFVSELIGTFILDIGNYWPFLILFNTIRDHYNSNKIELPITPPYSLYFWIKGINLVMDNPTMQNNEPMISAGIISGMVALVVSLAFNIR